MEVATFTDLLAKYPRIGIMGPPNSGKTSLAKTVEERPIYHTDTYMYLGWSEVPLQITDILQNVPSFVLEGMQVPRSLRKGLVLDCLVFLPQTFVDLTKRQAAMWKGTRTVLNSFEITIPIYTQTKLGGEEFVRTCGGIS